MGIVGMICLHLSTLRKRKKHDSKWCILSTGFASHRARAAVATSDREALMLHQQTQSVIKSRLVCTLHWVLKQNFTPAFLCMQLWSALSRLLAREMDSCMAAIVMKMYSIMHLQMERRTVGSQAGYHFSRAAQPWTSIGSSSASEKQSETALESFS